MTHTTTGRTPHVRRLARIGAAATALALGAGMFAATAAAAAPSTEAPGTSNDQRAGSATPRVELNDTVREGATLPEGTTVKFKDLGTNAVLGPGYHTIQNGKLVTLGGFQQDVPGGGSIIGYCLNLGLVGPWDNTTFRNYEQYGHMTADQAASVNAAVTKYGQNQEDNWAAAVQMFTWSTADPEAYGPHGGDADLITRAPAEQRDDILAKLAQIRDEASKIKARPANPAGAITIEQSKDKPYEGTLSVSGVNPGDAVGSIELTNGIFTDTGAKGIAGIKSGQKLAIKTDPRNGSVEYAVKADGSFFVPGKDDADEVYQGNIGVWQSAAGQQDIATPGQKAPGVFQITSEKTFKIKPMQLGLETKLDKTDATTGDTVTDTVTLGLRDGDQWYTDDKGNNIPVKVTGTAYWSATKPTQSADVPKDAEVIDTQELTVTSTDEITSKPLQTKKDGYTSFRWCTEAANEADSQRVEKFCDDYGVPAETVHTTTPKGIAVHTGGTIAGQNMPAGTIAGIALILAAAAGTSTAVVIRRRKAANADA